MSGFWYYRDWWFPSSFSLSNTYHYWYLKCFSIICHKVDVIFSTVFKSNKIMWSNQKDDKLMIVSILTRNWFCSKLSRLLGRLHLSEIKTEIHKIELNNKIKSLKPTHTSHSGIFFRPVFYWLCGEILCVNCEYKNMHIYILRLDYNTYFCDFYWTLNCEYFCH